MATGRESQIEAQLKLIDKISGITAENRKAARQYADKIEAMDKKLNTRVKHIYYLRRILTIKPTLRFANATPDDIDSLLLMFKRLKPSDAVLYDFKKILRFFFKTMYGEGLYYPKAVLKIKLKSLPRKITRSDILDQEEILKMLDQATFSRDKALIAIGYDAGIRVGELVNMRVKDVDLSNETAHISVNGKTGPRQVPIFFSVPYLSIYLNEMKLLKPDDYLWQNLARSHHRGPMSEFGVNKMLREVAGKAGITKRVHWHILRHTRATNYANKLTDAQLKNFFGWTGNSAMAATYVHLSGRDIDNATKRANGLEVKEEQAKPLLSAVECSRCKMQNGKDAMYCSRCGSALSVEVAMQQQKDKDRLHALFSEFMSNREAVERQLKMLKEKDAKGEE